MTANKFSQVGGGDLFAPRLHRSATRRTRSFPRVTRSAPRTDNGVRAWRFKTQQLRTYLKGAYPELKAGHKWSEVHDDGLALSKMIMNKTTTGGRMFAPV